MLKARPRLKLKGKPVRRRRHQSAWITFDEEAADRECWVEDVSQSGAKITVDMAAEVGSRFGITLIYPVFRSARAKSFGVAGIRLALGSWTEMIRPDLSFTLSAPE
jgi:hypothetical protein